MRHSLLIGLLVMVMAGCVHRDSVRYQDKRQTAYLRMGMPMSEVNKYLGEPQGAMSSGGGGTLVSYRLWNDHVGMADLYTVGFDREGNVNYFSGAGGGGGGASTVNVNWRSW
jgi:hypothetical protein